MRRPAVLALVLAALGAGVANAQTPTQAPEQSNTHY